MILKIHCTGTYVSKSCGPSSHPGGRFCFGSGYFNLTENYLHEILHGSRSDYDIIMAHPTVRHGEMVLLTTVDPPSRNYLLT